MSAHLVCPRCAHRFVYSKIRQRREENARKLRSTGKRCASCYAVKPAGAFGLAKARADKLQPYCRDCIRLRSTVLPIGGRQQWYLVRDTLRAQNDPSAHKVTLCVS